MDEPLGRTAGNALEVWEAVETLQGRGPHDLVKLTLDLAERVANVPRAQLAKSTGLERGLCGAAAQGSIAPCLTSRSGGDAAQ